MAAIQEPMLNALREILQERYVPYLPPLLGNADQANKPRKQVSRAFSAFVLQTCFGIDPETAAKAVIDDYDDHGVDAVYYHDEDKTLYFVQSKLKATEQFQLGEAQSFTAGVKLLINKNFGTFNQNVKNLEATIEDALDECDNIKLIAAFTGDGISIQALNHITQFIQDEQEEGDEQLQDDLVKFDAESVEEALRQEQAIKLVNDKIRIHKYRAVNEPRKTYYGIVSVSDLVGLHEKHGKGLYEKNIRYFIGAGRRGVNAAIKKTLLNEPENFLYLNNGITLVGNHIKQKSRARDNNTTRTFEVLGMSVVNGAQTISSAAQFVKDEPEADISKAQVMLTLVNTGTGDFHKQVTKARNLQNPVDLSNFAALDDNQERLRQEMALHGYDYHYRPQQAFRTGIPTIRIEELAKALACLHKDIRFPARLKSEAGLFTNTESDSYQCLFTTDLSGSVAINAVTAYNKIHGLLNNADRTSPSPERLVYRHCGYALASILLKRLKNKIDSAEILTAAQVEVLIGQPFDELRQQFADQYAVVGVGSAPHALFKRIPDTARITQKVAIEDQALSGDETVNTLLTRAVPADDPYNQALTNYLAGKAGQIQD